MLLFLTLVSVGTLSCPLQGQEGDAVPVIPQDPLPIGTQATDDDEKNDELYMAFRFDRNALRAMVVPERYRTVIDEMRSRDWAVRNQASIRLERLEPGLEMLFAILLKDDLDLEQRSRVLRLLTRLIAEMPRGAVGIRMNTNFNQKGVLVTAVIPGLPAEKFLKAGDLIVAIDDAPVENSEDLIAIVQSRKPGDRLSFVVARSKRNPRGMDELGADGRPVTEQLQFVIPLGSVAELDANGSVATSTRLDERRRQKIRLVQEAFGPKPVRVRTPSVIIAEAPFIGRSPDTHPSVLWLLSLKEIIDAGGDPFSDGFEKRAAKFLQEMKAAIADDDRTDAEQRWHQRSLERFTSLRDSF